MHRRDFFQKSSKWHSSCITVIKKYIYKELSCMSHVRANYRFNSLHLLSIFPLKKNLIKSAKAIFLENALAFIVFM